MATDTYGEIMANTEVDLCNNGYNDSVVITGTKTLAAADAGVVQDVNATTTITLPTSATGLGFIIRVGQPDITVTIQPQSTDEFIGAGITPATNKALLFTNAPAGSWIEVVGAGSNTYYVRRVSGHPTRQA